MKVLATLAKGSKGKVRRGGYQNFNLTLSGGRL